jgi:UDP-glucose 4-epimerase
VSGTGGGRRVLVTGLGTFWGGRVAQRLEADPGIDVIVGLDREDPTVRLERTEFVRADESYSILSRIVRAAQIDTIVHTFLVVDSTMMSNRTLHEINVIGTMNLLAAAGAAGSTVRTVIVKSSTLVYGSTASDPVLFREETPRSSSPRTRVERSLLEVEGYLRDFAEDNPHVAVSLLPLLQRPRPRHPDAAGGCARAAARPRHRRLRPPHPVRGRERRDPLHPLRAAPPGPRRVQRRRRRAPPVERGGGDLRQPAVRLPAALLHRRRRRPAPAAPPDRPAARGARPAPLRRGVDNRRLKHAGFRYDFTSAGAVERYWQGVRLRRTVGTAEPDFVYDADIETFFRRSPAVVRDQP